MVWCGVAWCGVVWCDVLSRRTKHKDAQCFGTDVYDETKHQSVYLEHLLFFHSLFFSLPVHEETTV